MLDGESNLSVFSVGGDALYQKLKQAFVIILVYERRRPRVCVFENENTLRVQRVATAMAMATAMAIF